MRVLVTGGSGSGKSAFAERACLSLPGPHVYVATMRPWGHDGAERVGRHRRQRAGRGFVTVERYGRYQELDLEAEVARSLASHEVPGDAASVPGVARGGSVLLECLGNVLANVQYEAPDEAMPCCDDAYVAETDVEVLASRLEAAVEALSGQCANLVIVTNEVGSDGVAYPAETEAYVRALGTANCRIAARADAVYEVAAGCPVTLKAAEGEVPWE